MSVEVTERVSSRIERRLANDNFEELEVGWFGAEPLLGLGAMRRLSPRLRSTASAQGVTYSAKIVTNGLRLTSALARELVVDHEVDTAEVTLDGPPAIHDGRRHTKSGRPSFAQIFGNLRSVMADDVPLKLRLRCNVDTRNVETVDELIDLIADAGLSAGVEMYLAPVYSWGNDADSRSLAPQEFAAREIEWLAHMQAREFTISLLPERHTIVCLAVRPHGELIDADGTLFNCTEVSYVPSYGRPNRYALGNVRADHEPSAPAPFRDFTESIADGRQTLCADCFFLPACGGSCPKQWSEGRIPCPPAKHNLSERLLLWYAQQRIAQSVTAQ
jgi:uncharacterized protein